MPRATAAQRVLHAVGAAAATLAFLWLLLGPLPSATAGGSDPLAGPARATAITIAFLGDVIPHQRLLDSAREPRSGTYDFSPTFRHIAPYLAAADYTVANLETPLAGPTTRFTGYPLFNAPLEFGLALRQAGVDLCSTANNHCLDRGWPGLVATLDRLDQMGLAHVGTSRSLAERETPLVVDIQGIRVAFLAYTEALNGHAPPAECKAYAVNRLAPGRAAVDQVATDAALARLWGADIVIALFHWGEEYQRMPTATQVAVAEGTADGQGLLARGVDVIIGHHPHVVQPLVRAAGAAGDAGGAWGAKYVAYSLGNFLSNQPWRYSDSGLVVYLHLEKSGFRTRVTGISYLPVFVQRDVSRGPTRYRVLPVLPGRESESDLPLTAAQRTRLRQIQGELEPLVFKPQDGIRPLDPRELGLLW
jgi:poly-gamma-glutamate capsule biosynthesis protein CapA/YwtB (metallophosphatase superfamily)